MTTGTVVTITLPETPTFLSQREFEERIAATVTMLACDLGWEGEGTPEELVVKLLNNAYQCGWSDHAGRVSSQQQ